MLEKSTTITIQSNFIILQTKAEKIFYFQQLRAFRRKRLETYYTKEKSRNQSIATLQEMWKLDNTFKLEQWISKNLLTSNKNYSFSEIIFTLTEQNRNTISLLIAFNYLKRVIKFSENFWEKTNWNSELLCVCGIKEKAKA